MWPKGRRSPRFLSRVPSTCRPKSRYFAGEARESRQSGVCFNRLLWRSEVNISKIVFNCSFRNTDENVRVLRGTIAEKLLFLLDVKRSLESCKDPASGTEKTKVADLNVSNNFDPV